MVGSEGAQMRRTVADDEAAGIVRHLDPFVKVERNRIGAIEPRQLWANAGREDADRTECTIDVEPELLVARDSG